MEISNNGKIVSLMRYPEKKMPAVMEETLTLTNMNHVSIMKSSVIKPHTEKRWFTG